MNTPRSSNQTIKGEGGRIVFSDVEVLESILKSWNGDEFHLPRVVSAIMGRILAEREACAKIVEEARHFHGMGMVLLADQIRARGEK